MNHSEADGYDKSLENKAIQDDNHYVLNYKDICGYDYDALIIAVSGKPFEDNDMTVIKQVLDSIDYTSPPTK